MYKESEHHIKSPAGLLVQHFLPDTTSGIGTTNHLLLLSRVHNARPIFCLRRLLEYRNALSDFPGSQSPLYRGISLRAPVAVYSIPCRIFSLPPTPGFYSYAFMVH